MRQHPVGKAQQVILSALSLEAESFQEADKLFAARGLSVTPMRQGRQSVPQVRCLDTAGGGFNAHGDGESYDIEYQPVDLDRIKEWLVE
jgi:hypothetical protein